MVECFEKNVVRLHSLSNKTYLFQFLMLEDCIEDQWILILIDFFPSWLKVVKLTYLNGYKSESWDFRISILFFLFFYLIVQPRFTNLQFLDLIYYFAEKLCFYFWFQDYDKFWETVNDQFWAIMVVGFFRDSSKTKPWSKIIKWYFER